MISLEKLKYKKDLPAEGIKKKKTHHYKNLIKLQI